jgi:hypothetical protein
MTLPELRATLARISPLVVDDAKLRDMFIARLDTWPSDTSTVERLLDDLNRILGNVWFSMSGVHQQVFEALEAFAKTVTQIRGMTLNERLFNLGFLDTWDASSDATKKIIRSKLGAA